MLFEKSSRKYKKVFLGEVSKKLRLKPEYQKVFLARFHPENLRESDTDLGKRTCDGAGNPAQTCRDAIKKALNEIAILGGPDVPKVGAKSPKWKDAYDWIWSQYDEWEIKYLERLPNRLLADHLLDLDIEEQKDIFTEVLAKQPVASFCVHLDSQEVTSQWVTASMLKLLPSTVETPFLIRIKADPYFDSLDWFWNGLSRYFSEDLAPSDQLEEMQTQLVDLCVETSCRRSCCLIVSFGNCPQDIEHELWSRFWTRVISHPRAKNLSTGHSLVLLIIRSSTDEQLQHIVEFQCSQDAKDGISNENLILLPPIDSIDGSVIVKWLNPRGKELIPIMGDNYSLLGRDARSWGASNAVDKRPASILAKICQCGKFDGGFDSVKQYWKSEAVA